MMEVYKNIFVGDIEDYRSINKEEYAVVSATKTVFNKRGDDVVFEDGDNLYLNWVDARDAKYFDYRNEGAKVASYVLDFIDNKIKDKKILIHCDEGISRSPSLAMLYLAKRAKVISDKDHVFAEREFSNIYPRYFAGKGISDFLFKQWFNIK